MMIVIASMWAWFTPTILFCVANLLIATLFLASKSNPKTTNNPNPSHNHTHDNYENTSRNQNHDENQSQNQNQNQNQMRNENENQNYEYSFTPQIPIVSSFLERARSINITAIIPTIITKTILAPHENPKYTSLSRLSQSIFSACEYDSQPDSPRYPSSKTPTTPPPSILGRLKSIDFSKIYGDSQKITNSPGQLARVSSVKFNIPAASTLAKKRKTKAKVSSLVLKKTRSEVKSVSNHKDEVATLQRPQTARARMDADDDAKAENFITKFREQLKIQRMDSLDRYNDMIRRP